MSKTRRFLKRHFAFMLPVYNAYLARRYRGRSVDEIFRSIYEANEWGGGESVSGQGSDLSQTETIRREIPRLLRSLGVGSVLDIPCGDLRWIGDLELGVDHYIGGDIVVELVEGCRQRYTDDRWDFRQLDLVRDELPKVDLILCRDCFVHFSIDLIHQALGRIKDSGSTYLLATTFPDATENADIQTGCWRKVNLQAPPFSFPDPLELINENCTEAPRFAEKSLGLWRIDDIRLD
jgi:hypothetical protein